MTGDQIPKVPIEPSLRLLYTSIIEADRPIVVGRTAFGERRIINIKGGRFAGPKLSGKVLPGGADWQIIRNDGVVELEAKYTLETEDGAFIYILNRGIRRGPREVMERLGRGKQVNAGEYYFRTTPIFETGAEKYAWLNSLIAVATGERRVSEVIITVYEVT